MAGQKRTGAQVRGQGAAVTAAIALGRSLRAARVRRRLTQAALAEKAGISRARVGQLETGQGLTASVGTWFTLAEALELPFRLEFGRDPTEQPADAGHLAMQELVLRLARGAGYTGSFELPTRPADPSRSTDVRLLDRRHRRLVLVECWNSFGDLGGAARSSDRKRSETEAMSIALSPDGAALQVGVCWVIRDTRRNRYLLARYPRIIESRFPGSSAAWVRALTVGGPLPDQPGLVWSDLNASRLFARRRTVVRREDGSAIHRVVSMW